MFIGIIPASQLVKFYRECSKNEFIFHFLVLLNLSFCNLREITDILRVVCMTEYAL